MSELRLTVKRSSVGLLYFLKWEERDYVDSRI